MAQGPPTLHGGGDPGLTELDLTSFPDHTQICSSIFNFIQRDPQAFDFSVCKVLI